MKAWMYFFLEMFGYVKKSEAWCVYCNKSLGIFPSFSRAEWEVEKHVVDNHPEVINKQSLGDM
jgi:hypothetical protein